MGNLFLLLVFAIALIIIVFVVLIGLVKKWPYLAFVFGLLTGLLVWIFTSSWIAAVIIGVLLCGFLLSRVESLYKKCSKCGSNDTELIRTDTEEGKRIELWKCNKCGNTTMFYET